MNMQDSKSLKFETLKKEKLYHGFFQLNRYSFRYQLFAGGWSEIFQREVFERGHAAGVLLIDLQAEMIGLVEQFRPGAVDTESNPWVLELVAGIIDPGEVPEEVVKREAVEEAGCHISRLAKIGEYLVSPGGTTERIWLFLGQMNHTRLPLSGGLAHEHEDIKVHQISVQDAFNLLERGQINNAMTLIALQWLKINWHRKEQLWD